MSKQEFIQRTVSTIIAMKVVEYYDVNVKMINDSVTKYADEFYKINGWNQII